MDPTYNIHMKGEEVVSLTANVCHRTMLKSYARYPNNSHTAIVLVSLFFTLIF